MFANPWIGQGFGKSAIGLSRFSPYLFSQREILNVYFLPKLRDLPQVDMVPFKLAFTWGFGQAAPGLVAYDVQNQIVQVHVPTFVWGVNGVVSDNTGSPNAQFQIFHTHDGRQRRWFNRPSTLSESAGSGVLPQLYRAPYLILPDDSIECEIQNLGLPVAPNVTSVQVTLLCGEVAPGVLS